MQSYQRFQCIGHTVFNTSGTNAPRSLSHLKVGTHSALLKESHTAAHTAKHGAFRMGRYHYPRHVLHVYEHPRAGCQNGVLCRFGILAGRCSRRTQKAFGTAMRLCVSLFRRRRGPAGLRDPIAVSLTALIGFTVLADRDYRVRKKAHFVFMHRAALPALPAPSAALLYALMH